MDTVDQMVHGYQTGHELFGSSLKLANTELELIRRLSDLSGSLGGHSKFKEYLTLYPLPNGKYYAFAKTWPDDDAPRSGCVLTQTLLIPMDEWSKENNPEKYLACFKKPSRSTQKEIEKIKLSRKSNSKRGNKEINPFDPGCIAFVKSYFEDNCKPVIWFKSVDCENYALAIIRALWPSLRQTFACCTFSLAGRELKNRSFDLLFAPEELYSKFHKYNRANLIIDSEPKISLDETSEHTTEVLGKWAIAIFAHNSESAIDQESFFQTILPPEPTNYKYLQLFRQLAHRLSESPTAMLGLLDLIEAVAPESNEKIEEKKSILRSWHNTIEDLRVSAENFVLLRLLCQRLDTKPFVLCKEALAGLLKKKIFETLTSLNNYNLKDIFDGEQASSGQKLFTAIVLSSFIDSIEKNPNDLLLLSQLPANQLEQIFNWQPVVAENLVSRAKEIGKTPIGQALIERCIQIFNASLFPTENAVRLIQYAIETENEEILVSLLSTVSDLQAHSILDLLAQTAIVLKQSQIETFATSLGAKKSELVKSWFSQNKYTSSWTAPVLAAAFQNSPAGFNELRKTSEVYGQAPVELLLHYLDHCAIDTMPIWIKDYLSKKPYAIEPLFRTPATSRHLSYSLARIVESIPNLALYRLHITEKDIAKFSGSSLYPSLINSLVLGLMNDFISDKASIDDTLFYLKSDWINNWSQWIHEWEFLKRFQIAINQPDAIIAHAWIWLNELPDKLYEKDVSPILDAVESILQMENITYDQFVTDTWINIIRRASLSNHGNYLSLCELSLDFCLRNNRLNLSSVVAETFETVHEKYIKSRASRKTFFAFLSWDKAEEIRKHFVSAFLNGPWNPGDLGRAMQSADLQRQIYERVLIHPLGGTVYLNRIRLDLEQYQDAPSNCARKSLLLFLSDHGLINDN